MSCTTPTIASGASVVVTIVVKATTLGTLSNTATVESNEPDTDSTNNASTQTTDVLEFVKFSATSYSVAESGPSVAVTVTRTGNRALSVGYATGNNTATAGSDYGAFTGTLVTIPAGAASTKISVAIVDDALPESSETFKLRLSGSNGAILGTQKTALGTNLDND